MTGAAPLQPHVIGQRIRDTARFGIEKGRSSSAYWYTRGSPGANAKSFAQIPEKQIEKNTHPPNSKREEPGNNTIRAQYPVSGPTHHPTSASPALPSAAHSSSRTQASCGCS